MNRAGVSVVRDRSPAGPAQDGMGGLPFLIERKTLLRPPPPLLPGDTPGRTSVGAPDLCPHCPTYSTLPPNHPCWACFFPSTGVILEAQRSFCLGGELMWPDLEWRVGATSSHDHQHWGHIRGFSVDKPGRRDPPKTCVLIKRHQDSCFSCCVVVLFSRG